MSYYPVMDLPRAILLDLDDTLIDDSGPVETCWADACAEAARRDPAVGPTALRRAIAEYAGWWWRDPERNRRGRLDLRAATAEIVAAAYARLGFPGHPDAPRIAHLYRDLREERAALFPDAIPVIEALRSRAVRLGMMTNGAGPAQRAKIRRFGLEAYFDHILIEGEAGYGKPDRRVFETLLSALDVRPAEAWAVGDNLEFDVLAPMALGVFGIWVNRHGRAGDGALQPQRTVSRLGELLPG